MADGEWAHVKFPGQGAPRDDLGVAQSELVILTDPSGRKFRASRADLSPSFLAKYATGDAEPGAFDAIPPAATAEILPAVELQPAPIRRDPKWEAQQAEMWAAAGRQQAAGESKSRLANGLRTGSEEHTLRGRVRPSTARGQSSVSSLLRQPDEQLSDAKWAPELDLTQPEKVQVMPELDLTQPADNLRSESGRPGSIRAMLEKAITGAAGEGSADFLPTTASVPSLDATEPEEAAVSAGGDKPIPFADEAVDQPVGTNAARALQLRGGAGRPDMQPAGMKPPPEPPTDWKGRFEGIKPYLPMILGGIEGMTPGGLDRMNARALAKTRAASEKPRTAGDAYKIAWRTPGTPESISGWMRIKAAMPDMYAAYEKSGTIDQMAGEDIKTAVDMWKFDHSLVNNTMMAQARHLDSNVRAEGLRLRKGEYALGKGSEFYDVEDEDANVMPRPTIAEKFGRAEAGLRAIRETHIPEVKEKIAAIVTAHPTFVGRAFARAIGEPDVVGIDNAVGQLLSKLRDAEGVAVTDTQMALLERQLGVSEGKAFSVLTMAHPERLGEILDNAANSAHGSLKANAQQYLGRGGKFSTGQLPGAPRKSIEESEIRTGSVLPKAAAKGRPAPQAAVSSETPEIPTQSEEDMVAEVAAIRARRAARAAGGK